MGYLYSFISCYPVLGQCSRTIPTENRKTDISCFSRGEKKEHWLRWVKYKEISHPKDHV